MSMLSTQTNTRPAQACAIVLAAGAGSRARRKDQGQPEAPKQFVDLKGKPLVAWSLETFDAHPGIATIILVLPAIEAEDLTNHIAALTHGTPVITTTGGATRRESTLAGIATWQAVAEFLPDAPILVHDGARPFFTAGLVDRLLEALNEAPGAIPSLPVTDTLKTHTDSLLTTGPDRSGLMTVQTPQAFRGPVLIQAHQAVASARPDEPFTDDASIVEWAGHDCVAVPGDSNNIKITTPADWDRAEAILQARNHGMMEPRTGLGYDVHRLVPGDGVWLCGHFIPHTHKLDGHSDADVGLHALTDALLGAVGEGDIGTHFPPSDPQWKGAASHIFLSHAAALIRERGGKIINVDVAIVAENPKINPHRDAMVAAMAQALAISPSRVSVKATTNERLGFAGREEGIAAFATASVMVPAND